MSSTIFFWTRAFYLTKLVAFKSSLFGSSSYSTMR